MSSKSLQHRINGTPKHITTDSCNCQFLRNHVVLYRPVEQTCKKKQTSNPQHNNSPITITELTVSNRFLFPKSLPMHARKLTLESPHCELALIKKRTLHSCTSSALYTLCKKKKKNTNKKHISVGQCSENFLTFRSAIFSPRLHMADLSLLD